MSSDSPDEGLLSKSRDSNGNLKLGAASSYGTRRMSFGIGGAGNIRNVSEATMHDFYVAQDGPGRRRSSAAESTSGSLPSRLSKVFGGVKSVFGSSPPKDAERRNT